MLCENTKIVEEEKFMWEFMGECFSTLLKFSTARIYQNTPQQHHSHHSRMNIDLIFNPLSVLSIKNTKIFNPLLNTELKGIEGYYPSFCGVTTSYLTLSLDNILRDKISPH